MNHRSVAILKMSPQKEGGLEKYMKRTWEAFEKMGTSVTWISNHPTAHVQWAPPAVPFKFLSLLSYNKFCKKHTSKHSYDTILGFERTTHQTHMRAGNGVHAAYLELRKRCSPLWKKTSFLFNPLHHSLLHLEKEGFENRELQALIVNSNLVKKQILSHYSVDPEKIITVHNGVEWDELANPFASWERDRNHFLEQHHLSQETLHLLFVGHNFERKGLMLLLDAMKKLSPQPFHLSVVGRDRQESFFQKTDSDFGLEKNVSFWGDVKNVIPFYQMADIVVIPSLYDPFANVTVEALAMGVFVLSSDLNGGGEVLNEKSGSVFPFFEKRGLQDHLFSLLSYRKTKESADLIRNSVARLSFQNQLTTLCNLCLS